MALFLPRLSFVLIVAGRADGEHHELRLACAKIHMVHLSQYRGKFFLTFQRWLTFRVRDPWCEYLLVSVAREGNDRGTCRWTVISVCRRYTCCAPMQPCLCTWINTHPQGHCSGGRYLLCSGGRPPAAWNTRLWGDPIQAEPVYF